ncbi:MAG: segregation/condensation protein A, partial [Deltaproteobacteria bacterium]|nr:segregation/condensation protein A [Deltaproteobacteria bacterium]
ITKKYLEYLDVMKELNLDLASEYLEMAATLALIKARMLLPTDEHDEDDVEAEEGPDPREELVRQLLEYQKYKTAAEQLASMPMLGRDTFPTGAIVAAAGEPDFANPGLFSLLEALQQVFERLDEDPATEITVTRISVSARIHQILDRLQRTKRLQFLELFGDHATRGDVVVSFLAILEITRLGLTRVHQVGVHGEIYISATADREEAEKILTEHKLEVE